MTDEICVAFVFCPFFFFFCFLYPLVRGGPVELQDDGLGWTLTFLTLVLLDEEGGPTCFLLSHPCPASYPTLLRLTSLEELMGSFMEALLKQACSGILREIIKT